jgi:hypothetical protein
MRIHPGEGDVEGYVMTGNCRARNVAARDQRWQIGIGKAARRLVNLATKDVEPVDLRPRRLRSGGRVRQRLCCVAHVELRTLSINTLFMVRVQRRFWRWELRVRSKPSPGKGNGLLLEP